MNTIGLDLSLTATGLANSNGETQLIGRAGVTRMPMRDRIRALKELRSDIVYWISVRMPDLVAIELPTFSTSATGSIERHYLYLDVIDGLLMRSIPVAEVASSSRIKYATGKGVGGKNAVVDAVARRLPMFETGGNDNECDAAILCAMAADHLGEPLAVMPVLHREALAKVRWPVVMGDES